MLQAVLVTVSHVLCLSVLVWIPWHSFIFGSGSGGGPGVSLFGVSLLVLHTLPGIRHAVGRFFDLFYLVTVLAAWQLLGGWRPLVFPFAFWIGALGILLIVYSV